MASHVRLAITACTCAVLITTHESGAQSFPVKPVRMINPAAPGGNSDIFFRLLQPKMNEVLGQPIVMDYRPGAGGTVGGEVIARSAPLPVPTLEKFPVAVIRGTKVSEQTFVRDRGNSWAEQPGLKQ